MMKNLGIRRRLNRISIPNLMTYVVIGMAAVFVLDMLAPVLGLPMRLTLIRDKLFEGEIWRLVSFVFLPPSSSPLWIIFSLYLYWMIGASLESQWGSSKFTLFYLVGVIGNIIAALISGYAGNSYLNMSLYLAFAALNPNYQLMLFMILPVKIKYLALLDVVGYLIAFIAGDWSTKLTILFSLGNLVLFLGGDMMNTIRQESRYWKTRRNFRKAMRGR